MNFAQGSLTSTGAAIGTVAGLLIAFNKNASLGKIAAAAVTGLVIGAGIGFGVSLIVKPKEETVADQQEWK